MMTAVLVGCGRLPPPTEAKAGPSEAETRPTPAPDEGEPPAPASSTSAAEAEPEPAPPSVEPQRALDDLCARISARAKDRCSKQVAEFYATNCRRYAKATQCQAEIIRALECQVNTPEEMLCAHQADPNCTKLNQQLQACDKGKAPVEQTQPEDLTLPSNWETVQDSKLGFSVAMPKGAALEEKDTQRLWKAQEGSITYVVATAEPPVGKLSSAAVLRTITKYLGNRCQLKLKVRGEFELKGVTVVQYESGCTDGTTWRGMMHFWDGKVVSTGLHGPGGAHGVLEPYFFSFAVSGP